MRKILVVLAVLLFSWLAVPFAVAHPGQPVGGCLVGRVLNIEERGTPSGCTRFIDVEVYQQWGIPRLAKRVRIWSRGCRCSGRVILSYGGDESPIQSISVREPVIMAYTIENGELRLLKKGTLSYPLYSTSTEGIRAFNNLIRSIACARSHGCDAPWASFEYLEVHEGFSMQVLSNPNPVPLVSSAEAAEELLDGWYIAQICTSRYQSVGSFVQSWQKKFATDF